MIKCNECDELFRAPDLRQPINPRTGHVRWDEDYAALCPHCHAVLTGDEVEIDEVSDE